MNKVQNKCDSNIITSPKTFREEWKRRRSYARHVSPDSNYARVLRVPITEILPVSRMRASEFPGAKQRRAQCAQW